MGVNINDSKSLGKALKENEDEIIVEGDLKNKVLRIKATGKVAWTVAIGAIGVAVVSIIAAPATGGISGTANFIAAPAAVSILGGTTTTAAISIAVAGGGIGALNKLRKYKVVKNDENQLILKRK